MTPREFALNVVQQLQAAGYQALWAGGCVRDQLLGLQPKDYDVATSANPDEVRKLFGKKRTLAIGASFGVITVLGPKRAGPIEVATFRRDSGYSDGRHPDAVEFTDAHEDARRRDFTINGMFYDPILEDVIDYVDGQKDIARKRVRAIGCPEERIDEDKLRMLRGVRFAATFDFEIEPETLSAIQKHASEIIVVSGERIGAEMRRMLASPHRTIAARLLRTSGLLAEILPNGKSLYGDENHWDQILSTLDGLEPGDFESAAMVLLEPILRDQGIDAVFERWKLSNDERKSILWVFRNWEILDRADRLPWSQIQPLLLAGDVDRALAVAQSKRGSQSKGVAMCRTRLQQWTPEQLDPKPFLDGRDLMELGFKPGPNYGFILDSVRAAQLDGLIHNVEQAIEQARDKAAELSA